MKVNDAFNEIKYIGNEIDTLLSRTEYVKYGELDVDIDNKDDLFLCKESESILEALDDINRRIKYLKKPIKYQGRLFKNREGRYEIDKCGHYYTSGDNIEAYIEEDEEWIITRVEYKEDYYLVGYEEVNIENLLVRVR